jgi:FkbM family methyltransferase
MSAKAAVFKTLTSGPMDVAVRTLFRNSIPHYGNRIRMPADFHVNAAAIALRLYERAEVAMVRNFLPTDIDVVELGSSIGVVSCQIARRLRNGARLIAVEANPRLAEHTRFCLEENGLHGVEVINAAIDYGQRPEVPFSSPSHLMGKTGHGEMTVPAITLGDIVRRFRLEKFSLVADIEGAEIPLLLNDSSTLSACQMIQIEMHPTHYAGKHYSVEDVQALTQSLGFECFYRYRDCAAFRRVS